MRLLIVVLLLLSVPANAGVSVQPEASEVRQERPDAASVFQDDVVYSLTQGDVRAVLALKRDIQRLRFELSQGGHVEFSAQIAAARKMEFLKPLLQRLFQDEGPAEHYLFVMNFYTEMGVRIADSAAKSRHWDRRSGRDTVAGEDFTLKLLKQTSAPYEELASTMESFHYRITIESIEHPIVLPFSQFSSYERTLMTTTPGPDDKLPCGASVYFLLKKEN